MRRKLDSSDEDEEEGIEEEEIDNKVEDAVTTAKSVMLQKKGAMMTKIVDIKMESTTVEQWRQRKEVITAKRINYDDADE